VEHFEGIPEVFCTLRNSKPNQENSNAMRHLFTFLVLFSLVVQTALSQTEPHSTIALSEDDYHRLIKDPTHGIAIDHFHKHGVGQLEFVLSESELQKLRNRGISYEVLIDDYEAHFLQLVEESSGNRSVGCGLDNFDDGDMGGYHTYDQTIAHINAMENLYDDFVRITEIGQSLESRPIYAVKISDNPDMDESAEEGVVYFDAITHSREPMSLEATLHYMWWLLEHMEEDEEVKYLVENREMYFVPMVNPDGYVYNELTNPNGGGLWRKNRRDVGNGCFGVDLNRNYGYNWGLEPGSSSDACTNIYRGEAPFSEPESSAVADFLAQINPPIAFTSHTFGDLFISPWGYVDSFASYELYAEFSSEFIPTTYRGYGTSARMLGGVTSGTTRDYMHSEGILGWTSEIGHTFWESPDVICDRVDEFRKGMLYLTWVCGNYTCYHDFTVYNEHILLGDTISMDIRVKNRGLTKTASDVVVRVTPMHSSVASVNEEVSYGSIEERAFSMSANGAFTFEVTDVVSPGEQLPFMVEVFQENTLSYRKTITLTAGVETILYQTDFESDNAWLNSNTEWDTSFMDATSGLHSFADSRYGNYDPNSNTRVVMDQALDLSETTQPYVSFNAKWALEPESDFVYVQMSTNGGANWVNLSGMHTNDQNQYTQNSHWIQECIDLSNFIGETEVLFAFQLISDGSVHSDGMYIDDFKISDFTDSTVVSTNQIVKDFQQPRLDPNPTTGTSMLRIHSSDVQNGIIEIYALNGTLLTQENIILSMGLNSIPIDGKTLGAGVYLVSIQLDGRIFPMKLIVGISY